MRQAEMLRHHARLGALSAEQQAAVEALTRGLVNKFLHPPMQALKQAAREGDAARLDVVCEEWQVAPAATAGEAEQAVQASQEPAPAETASETEPDLTEPGETEPGVTEPHLEARR
jgi:glutamyl-tRNA reductase